MSSARTLICSVVLLVVVFIMAPGTGLPALAQDHVILPDPDLPPESNPPDCDDLTSLYASGGEPLSFNIIITNWVMSNILHRCFTDVNRQIVGIDELETFNSIWDAMMDIGAGAEPVSLTGPVQTIT